MLDRLLPETEDEVADIIRAARAPLRIIGGGTRGRAGDGAVLAVAGLSGVSLYEPGALTLVAGAGTPIADIDALLATENQRLAFEPPDLRGILQTEGISTLGGVMATNSAGPRRLQAGAARDFALGVRFVDGNGTIVKNGGRVMKNVTGYDLVKLMVGSRGTLGVLTEIALKVLPAPETQATIAMDAADPTHGVQMLCAAMASPFDVTGAAWVDGVAYVRVEGFEPSVRYRTGALIERLGAGDVCHDDTLWRGIRDVVPLQGVAGDLWRISVKPTDGPKVLRRLGGQGFLDWGGGLVWASVPEGHDVRGALSETLGHATLYRGTGCGPARPPEGAATQISAGIKAKFDPRGIFNTGKAA